MFHPQAAEEATVIRQGEPFQFRRTVPRCRVVDVSCQLTVPRRRSQHIPLVRRVVWLYCDVHRTRSYLF